MTEHGVRLATASLVICEHAAVEAMQGIVEKLLPDGCINSVLAHRCLIWWVSPSSQCCCRNGLHRREAMVERD